MGWCFFGEDCCLALRGWMQKLWLGGSVWGPNGQKSKPKAKSGVEFLVTGDYPPARGSGCDRKRFFGHVKALKTIVLLHKFAYFLGSGTPTLFLATPVDGALWVLVALFKHCISWCVELHYHIIAVFHSSAVGINLCNMRSGSVSGFQSAIETALQVVLYDGS